MCAHTHKQLINVKFELEQNGELSILFTHKNQFNVELCFIAKTNQNKQQKDISREFESQINHPYQFQTEGTSESSFCQTRPCFFVPSIRHLPFKSHQLAAIWP